ncbi:MAG: hypothetical protein LIO77_08885 [Rikenellaceae bacterium]|nr:hypothetical protein [Rikenellaceae bacterium]
MKPLRLNSAIISFLCLLTALTSCGPVNMLTRAKKVPREYAVNYNHENVKAERSEINKKVWIVYSDRSDNNSIMTPGGMLTHSELGFMEPLLVTGTKGDYYKLLKYDPGILDNQKLKKRKEAEFYGWIHKDLLLLFDNPETDVRNDIKLKYLTSIADSRIMLDAGRYFAADSVILYSDPKCETPYGAIAPGSIVYILKRSKEGSKALVTTKTTLDPDKLEDSVIGWVDLSLIRPFGQRLAFDSAPTMEEISQPDSIVRYRAVNPAVSLSPALNFIRQDSVMSFRTLDAIDMIDHSHNRVFNVDGGTITYVQSREIVSRLSDINVIFSIMPTQNVAEQLPVLSNIIHNLRQVFDSSPDFSFKYSAVAGSQVIPFTDNYLSFGDRVIEMFNSTRIEPNISFTDVLQVSLAQASLKPECTNVIILVGEQSPAGLPKDITDDFIRYNCRLLSYQAYADSDDAYNDFVLHSFDIINAYAQAYRDSKRKMLVHTGQLTREDSFSEVAKNSYALDFPLRSMTQGAVIFPGKGRFADTDLFMAGVDSLIRQVCKDNRGIIHNLENTLSQVGNHYSYFNEDISRILDLPPQTPVAPYITGAFEQAMPVLVNTTGRIQLPADSTGMSHLGLLLSEEEYEDFKMFFERLFSLKPDKKGETSAGKIKSRHVRKVRRDLRGTYDDLEEYVENKQVTDSLPDSKYRNTGKVRRHLMQEYLNALKSTVFEGRPKHLTLAQAQEYITTLPTLSPVLEQFTINDIKHKKRLTDGELDMLIEYFETQFDIMEESTIPVDDLNPGDGEKYYFMPSQAFSGLRD